MAKLYLPSGEVRDVEPKDKEAGFELEELYELLDCDMIQPIFYMKGKVFICDEEFRLKPGWQEKRNKTVNDLIISETGDNWDLAGNVLICNEDEFK